jgi:aminoglycoside phosphotransferase (APT) family kinase protein
MDRIDGCTGEPVLDEHPLLDPPSTIPAVWKEAIDMLAALGALDPSTLGLAAREPVLGPAEELTRWAATARAAGEVLPPRAARLHDALARNVPAAERTSLVHGDYRIGNTVRAGGHIAGLIDWEIWSLGDTRADLGWLMLFCDTTSFPGIGREVPGTPSADDVLARYAAASGTMPQHMPWFHALACFKLAAVQAHNLRRHEEGRRPDSFLERFRASIERLLDVGLTRITGCAGQVGR